MEDLISIKAVVNVLVFSFMGLGFFAIGFMIFDRVTPGNFWKEINEEHNTALAILAGAIAIGISIIIAAAIQG